MVRRFTSESVAAGHPDKICDRVSDGIVDAALAVDPRARVAVETLVTKERIVLAGEVTCTKQLPYEQIARDAIAELGYTVKTYGFSDKSPLSCYIHSQSPDIAKGVDVGGAGDQGMMFGYACTETPELMPLPITLAHRLAEKLDAVRKDGSVPYLRPDGKTEVTVRYENGKSAAVEAVVVAVPHDPGHENGDIRRDLIRQVIAPVLGRYGFAPPEETSVIVNGTGVWEIGGPASDTGVTGRKIIVDTYGGFARHGGGAFSGKDPTKVDRSGAYACRYVAKNIVASGRATKAEVRVAYVIGREEPLAWDIDCFGTEKTNDADIRHFAGKLLDLRVRRLIDSLDLRRPIYAATSAYGHFGRDGFPWETIV